jgi:hypothetical protein
MFDIGVNGHFAFVTSRFESFEELFGIFWQHDWVSITVEKPCRGGANLSRDNWVCTSTNYKGTTVVAWTSSEQLQCAHASH